MRELYAALLRCELWLLERGEGSPDRVLALCDRLDAMRDR